MISLNYLSSFPDIVDGCDELVVKYIKNIDIIQVLAYSKIYNIVIDVTECEDDSWYKDIVLWSERIGKNLTLKIREDQYFEDIALPFFTIEHIRTWDQLRHVVRIGASQAYITDELGFDLVRVSEFCKDNNITIRLFPNVAQTYKNDSDKYDIKSFFLRPEALEILSGLTENYYIEFFGTKDRQLTLTSIYSKQFWKWDIDTLIIGLDTNKVMNPLIPPIFDIHRMDCRKECGAGKKCNICDRCLSIANLTIDRIINDVEQEQDSENM